MFKRLVDSPASVTVLIDGQPFRAAAGDTVSAALLLAGNSDFRRTARRDLARGPFCGMGVCFDCLVTIDDAPNRQACLVPVREGMRIETGTRLPHLAEGSTR